MTQKTFHVRRCKAGKGLGGAVAQRFQKFSHSPAVAIPRGFGLPRPLAGKPSVEMRFDGHALQVSPMSARFIMSFRTSRAWASTSSPRRASLEARSNSIATAKADWRSCCLVLRRIHRPSGPR